jgi:hypothetical protein
VALEDDGAGAFAADERAGDVEAVLGQELVEVEAGDAARDAGNFCGPGRRRSRMALRLGVDLADAAALRRCAASSASVVGPTVRRVPS